MKPIVKKFTYLTAALLSATACATLVPTLQSPVAPAKTVVTAKAAANISTASESLAERRYYDETAVAPRGILDNIYYARKEQTYTLFDYYVPYYSNSQNLANACGPVAGAIVVGYYDKFYEDLIPDFVSYYASGRYKFNDSTYVPALIQDLYTRMRTNVDDVGVSEADCVNGLSSYVQSKNHHVAFTSVKNWDGSINHTLCDDSIAQGKPLLLFCDNVSLYSVGGDDGYDNWVQLQTSGAHIAVAFGFLTINYYDENDTLIRTDHHLEVATGWGTNRCGYLNANDGSWLNNGYIVNIT